MSFPRYSKYKDSGVAFHAEAPAHWMRVPLKSLARYQNGFAFKPEDWGDEGLPIIRIAQLTSDEEPNRFSGSLDPRVRVADGDLLFSWSASIDSYIWTKGDGWLNQHIFKVTPSKECHKKFLFYLIKHVAPKLTDFDAHGSTMRHIKKESLGERVYLPPLPEQTAIATFLDRETAKIDALIAEQQRLIALLQEKRQAVISHAVTKGLNPDAPMKDSGIEWLGEVPEHWEVCRVKAVSSFTTSGPRGWSERVGDDGALFVQSGDLTDSMEVDFGNCKRVQIGEDAEVEAARTRLQDGDVVVCVTGAKTGNVAVCASVPESSYVNQHVCLIRPTTRVLPLFLGMVLKSGYGETYFSLAQYGLKQGLSLENVREAPVILPPLEEQRAITQTLVDLATRLRSLVAEAERAIALLQERRSALISAAVTGQIDVRGLAGSEAA